MKALFDRGLTNIILMGISTVFSGTAGNALAGVARALFNSIAAEDENFTGDGYIAPAISFISMAVSLIFAPSLINLTGPKMALFLGFLPAPFYYISYLWPSAAVLYGLSVLIGFGASLAAVAQGNYLTLNSDDKTISRNSGLFWAFLNASIFLGNLLIYIQFQGVIEIDADKRQVLVLTFMGMSIVAILFTLTLRAPPEKELKPAINNHEDEKESKEGDLEEKVEDLKEQSKFMNKGPVVAFIDAGKLLITKNMLILCIFFMHTGLVGTFIGIYSASVGFTLQMGEYVKQYIGIVGICVGTGEISGGLLFGIFGDVTIRWGRSPVVVLGYFLQVCTYSLIYINIPYNAPFGDTNEVSIIHPDVYVSLACGLLLGFGDACYNTQLYSLLGEYYSEQSVSAFTLMRFIQALVMGMGFLYSTVATIPVHYGILLISSTLALASYWYVERVFRLNKIKNIK